MRMITLTIIAACLCIAVTALTGCVSLGKDFDEANIAKIQKGVTTEADLVAWFGKPSNRASMSDGTVSLMWSHYTSSYMGATTGKTLTVTLDSNGKVSNYTSSGGEM